MLQWLRHKLASWLFPEIVNLQLRVGWLEADARALRNNCVDKADLADLAGDLNALRNRFADAPPAQPAKEPKRFATWGATRAALERKSA